MRAFAISALRANLRDLIDDVEQHGETIVVTRRGRPVAKLVAINEPTPTQGETSLRGMPLVVADDFDEPMDDLWEALTP